MKKFIIGIIEQLNYLCEGEKITIENGFMGIKTTHGLKNTFFVGNAYFMRGNDIFTDYDTKNNKPKLLLKNINKN